MTSQFKEWLLGVNIPRFPVRKLWKALKYSLWTVSVALAATVSAFVVRLGLDHSHGMESGGLVWTFLILLPLWIVLVTPYAARWMGNQVEFLPAIFWKQSLVFWAASLVPVGFWAACFLCAFYFSRMAGAPYFHSWWVFVYLGLTFPILTAWSVLLGARDLAFRMRDALRVISNGMGMIGQLDFGHPIATLAGDEIGRLADTFSETVNFLRTRIHIMQALFNNIRIFSSMLSEDQILDHTIKTFMSLEESEEVVIALGDEVSGEMVVLRSALDRPEVLGLRFSQGQGVFGRLLKDHEFLAYTAVEYSRIAQDCENEKKLWGKSEFVVGVPMLFKEGITGAIVLYNLKFGGFQLELKQDYLQGLANQIAIFIQNARLYDLVIRDRLTGLFVHSFIEAELENLLAQAKRYHFPICYVMLDVDHFKQVNDTHGHPVGNRLLQAIAGRIRSVSRDSDLISRYGGDEFEIILPHTDKRGGMVYAEKLLNSVREMEFEAAPGVDIKVTLSIGLADFPGDAQTAQELQEAADNGLYGAKALGRNCIVMYEGALK